MNIKKKLATSMDLIAKESALSAESLTWLEASTIALHMGTTIADGNNAGETELAIAMTLQKLAELYADRHLEVIKRLAVSRADLPTEKA